MRCHPDLALSKVEVLCLNVSIQLDTAASVLVLCPGVKCLNMRIPCHLIGKNPILDLLNNLSHLKALYVDLSLIFNKGTISLPTIPIFRQVTHLHLTNVWVTWNPAVNSISLNKLEQLTHLSIHLSTIRTMPTFLENILQRKNLAVFVLWKHYFTSDNDAACFLAKFNLTDKHILVLGDELFQHHMLDNDFWTNAEHVVKRWQDMEGL